MRCQVDVVGRLRGYFIRETVLVKIHNSQTTVIYPNGSPRRNDGITPQSIETAAPRRQVTLVYNLIQSSTILGCWDEVARANNVGDGG